MSSIQVMDHAGPGAWLGHRGDVTEAVAGVAGGRGPQVSLVSSARAGNRAPLQAANAAAPIQVTQ
jgi:hypothetical protein